MSTHQSDAAHPPARAVRTIPASRPDLELLGFEHCFATVDGVRLHYVTGGKEDDEVIVLLAACRS